MNDLWVIQINPVVKAIQIETNGSKPKARLWHTATLVANDTMYVFGGKSSESGTSSSHFCFTRSITLPCINHNFCLLGY